MRYFRYLQGLRSNNFLSPPAALSIVASPQSLNTGQTLLQYDATIPLQVVDATAIANPLRQLPQSQLHIHPSTHLRPPTLNITSQAAWASAYCFCPTDRTRRNLHNSQTLCFLKPTLIMLIHFHMLSYRIEQLALKVMQKIPFFQVLPGTRTIARLQ
jgi:hypothetical protein